MDPVCQAMAIATSSSLLEAMRRHLFLSQAKSPSLATSHDHYLCLALAVKLYRESRRLTPKAG